MLNKKRIFYTVLVLCLGFCLSGTTVHAQDQLTQLQNKVDQLQDHWISLQNNQIDITSKLKKQNQQLEREIEKLRQQLQQLERQSRGIPEKVSNQTKQQQQKLKTLEQSLREQQKTQNRTIDNLKNTNAKIDNKLQNLEQKLQKLSQEQESKTRDILDKTDKYKQQMQKYKKDLKQKIDKQQKKMQLVNKNLQKVYKQTLSEVGGTQRYNLGVSADLNTSYYAIDRDMDDVSNLGSNDPNYADLSDDSDGAFLNYLDLKLYGEIGNELKFQSTLTMYKLWGSWTTPLERGYIDFNYSARPSNSGLNVKRAYADYRPKWLNRSFNLTFGRLPTTGGYLTKYRYNKPSPSSYPDLSFNGASDGVATTFYFDQISENDIPILNSINLVYVLSLDDTDPYPYQTDKSEFEDIGFYVAQLNSEIPFLEDSSFITQIYRTNNIRPSQVEAITEETNFDVTFPEELGYVDKLTLQFDDPNFLGTPIDIFASYSYCRTEPNGEQIWVHTPNGKRRIQDIKPGGPYYLTSRNNQESETAHAVYTGFRYNIEQDTLKNPKLGFEYYYGSKYWVGLVTGAIDPFQKMNTRGQVYEGYWIQPLIENKFQLRTGYQYIQRDYTDSLLGGLYGPPKEIDEKAKLFYVDLNLKF